MHKKTLVEIFKREREHQELGGDEDNDGVLQRAETDLDSLEREIMEEISKVIG